MNSSRHLLEYALLAVAIVALGASSPTHASPLQSRGAVHTVKTLTSFSREAIDEENRHLTLSGPALCDVKIMQLTYESIGIRGEPETLSAGLYVPEHCAGPLPLLAQAHGTQSEKQSLTTTVGAGDDVVAFFAARGYLVVTTDYLGLGESTFPYHPYLHADSEASAIIDSIRAARRVAKRLDIPLSDQVMLFGYSQGGHAAMAAQREIERHHRDELHLVASAPMAGPYSLSLTFLGSWFGITAGQENELATGLLAYALVSYNKTYGTLYDRPEQIFAKRYADGVEKFFTGSYDMMDMFKQHLLPPGSHLNELRNPAFTADFVLDEHNPLREALRKNDLLDWAPTTPTVLCGSHRDAIVDFNNTYAAQASFRARGVDVPVIDVADEVPASVSGAGHHGFAFLCYAKVRERLFDPIASRHRID